jgi:shikimate dehydrogenase
MDMADEFMIGGLIGDPVDHSVSHVMFREYGELSGVPWIHLRLRIDSADPHNLQRAVDAIRLFNFRGFNITIPYKIRVMELLDEIDSTAKYMGAVNTIVNTNGKIVGYNTDGLGAIASIQNELLPLKSGQKVLIIGAGGAARAIAFEAYKLTRHVVILNRTQKKAEQLVQMLRTNVGPGELHALPLTEEHLKREIMTTDLVVNATPVGMGELKGESLLSEELLLERHTKNPKQPLYVYDAIYNPLKTKLIQDAEKHGIRAANGMGMMIHQGVAAFKLWTGKNVPQEKLPEVIRKIQPYLH